MHYIIAKDNFSRDCHNDKLVALQEPTQSVQDMQNWCDINNHDCSLLYYVVTDDLTTMYLTSTYDYKEEIPTFDTFCNYTGLDLLPHDHALVIYNLHFNIQG
jgi:hypothetical protein